jgi:hypothetical protein
MEVIVDLTEYPEVQDGLKRFVRCARRSELAGSKPAGVTGREIW